MPGTHAGAPDAPPTTPDPTFVDAAEAARLLGLSRREVYRLLDRGQLLSRRHGSRRLVLLASVQAYAYRLPA